MREIRTGSALLSLAVLLPWAAPVEAQIFPADGFVVVGDGAGPDFATIDERLLVCRGQVDVDAGVPKCRPSTKLPAGASHDFIPPEKYLVETVGKRAGSGRTVEYLGMSGQVVPTRGPLVFSAITGGTQTQHWRGGGVGRSLILLAFLFTSQTGIVASH